MARTGPNFKRYIESITIDNPGSSYSSSNPPVLFIGAPDSTDADAALVQATATIEILSNIVQSLTIVNPGDGYKTVPEVYLIGELHSVTNTSSVDSRRTANTYLNVPLSSSLATGRDGGSGATFNIVVDATGAVTSIVVNEGGSGFAEGEQLIIDSVSIGGSGNEDPITMTVATIAGGGSGATFTPKVNLVNKPQQYFHQNSSYITPFEIPEFIRNDYPKFASFIQKYYNFLDLDDSVSTELGLSSQSPNYVLQELLDRLSVNHYHGDFIETLLQQYAIDFPLDKQVDSRLLVKRIRDYYEAKGSRKGVETFFRTVYGENVEVFKPSEYVLRASDGIWTREVTIKVYANDELTPVPDILELRGRKVRVYYYVSTASITQRQFYDTSVSRVKQIAYTNPPAYELTIDIPEETAIPGPGVEGEISAVIGGKIATVDSIGAADASRSSAGSPYTITTGFTTDGNGTGAEFTITVDGSGAASVVVDTVGDNYAPDETITIPDSLLGSGGAADLTFDVATITEGKIFSVNIDNAGQGYSANPLVIILPNENDTITTQAVISARLTDNSISSTVFVNGEQGEGYNNVPLLALNTDLYRTYISLETDTLDVIANKKGFLTRVLTQAVFKSNSGQPDGGFAIGDTFSVQETGDVLGVYAIDYFSQDYTITGISNNAFIRVSSIDDNNYPLTLEVISTGVGFQRASFDFILRSSIGETTTITCTTGYSNTFAGEYKDARGFLSDINKLQDNLLYQDYAYQIRSGLSKVQWNDSLKRTGHTAGMVAFSDLQIHHDVDFSVNLNIIPDTLVFRLFSDVEAVLVQDAPALFLHKPTITDSISIQDDEALLEPGLVKNENPDASDVVDKFDVTMLKTDSVDMSEAVAKDFNKNNIQDSITFGEFVDLLLIILREPLDSVDMTEVVTFISSLNKTENPSVNDVYSLEPGLSKAETPSMGDDIDKFDVTITKTDSPDMADVLVLLTGSVNADSPEANDTGDLINQDYTENYFTEDYVGEARSF